MKTLDNYIYDSDSPIPCKKVPLLDTNNRYSHNQDDIPIHHWYTLVAGFSGDYIREKLKKFNIQQGDTLLDPFMGTGTSALIGMLKKLVVKGIDANPFTHFVSKVKTNFQLEPELATNYFRDLNSLLNQQLKNDKDFHWENVPTINLKDHLKNIWGNRTNYLEVDSTNLIPPAMPHLKDWLSPRVLVKVLTLKKILDSEFLPRIDSVAMQDFILLAFSSILLSISNLQLSGPKIAYRRSKKERILCIDAPVYRLFLDKFRQMVKDLNFFKDYSGLIYPELNFGDSRYVDQYVNNSVDIALTSPPYLNEVDYLDNTRLELYFLNFIKNDDDLKRLKKLQIRGNSKYLFNDNKDYPTRIPQIPSFSGILQLCEQINKIWEKRKWGWDHPRLVAEYFIDMTAHLQSMYKVLKTGGHYVFIVGDSAIDGILVSTDEILAKIALDIGFSKSEVSPFRKRGSSRHTTQLRESIVSLTK